MIHHSFLLATPFHASPGVEGEKAQYGAPLVSAQRIGGIKGWFGRGRGGLRLECFGMLPWVFVCLSFLGVAQTHGELSG